jgi:hypothetical protein
MRPGIHGLGATALLLLAASGVGAQESVRLLGELRLRSEVERTAVVDTTDVFTLSRARLGLLAELGGRASVFLQVQDARTLGEEASTVDASADRLDLHQAYLELVRGVGGSADLALRAGRQEIVLGNERLVGPVGWSNTGRSFDGARLTLAPESKQWTVTALAAVLRERGRRLAGTQPVPERADQVLLGAYADTKLFDVYGLFDRSDAQRTFTGIDRGTFGGKVDLPALGPLTVWGEGALQVGNQLAGGTVDQDISAYFFGGRATLAFGSSPLASLGAGLDYLSGDETPADGEYEAFNVLYHTGHKWYGYMDLWLDPAARTGERGLVDALASATLRLRRDWVLALDVHRFSTAAQRTADEASELGWELDATLPLAIAPNQRLQLGYSAYRNGEAMPLLGLGEADAWWHWGYAMLTFSFGGR